MVEKLNNSRNIIDNRSKALISIPPAELEAIYRSGKVSPTVQNTFRTSLDKSLSSEGMSIDQYIEMNRRLKVEMKEYLDRYKVQRSLLGDVIFYLKNPNLASVRIADKIGGIFGKKLQLEAKKIANDPHAIRKLFEEMVLSIEQSRGKTLELEKQAITLYNASLRQREDIEKDVVELLQKISINKDQTIQLEKDFNKMQETMEKLLKFMEELGIQIRGGMPVLEPVESKFVQTIDDGKTSYEARMEQLLNKSDFELGKVENKKETENLDKEIEANNKDKEIEANNKDKEIQNKAIKDKKIIESIKVYHSINNELVKMENLLRDANNEKLVLHQNYEKAKENLTLYERVLINQINEARNYFAILFAIYDAEVKYTLPSARLIAYLASLQEVAVQLAQQLYDSRNIFNSILDNVTQGALEIQEGIQALALNPSWDPTTIEHAEARTIALARKTNEFAKEMDKRLMEIEAIYRDPIIQARMKKIAIKDSGIEDKYLTGLLAEKNIKNT